MGAVYIFSSPGTKKSAIGSISRTGTTEGSRRSCSGTAERDAALALIEDIPRGGRSTLAGDKNFDTQGFVAAVREHGMTPHVAQNTSSRRSAIDGRTTRHLGYEVSQQKRKRIEEVFGWLKTVGMMRKTRHRGTALVDWIFTLALAGYNLVRIRNLTMATA